MKALLLGTLLLLAQIRVDTFDKNSNRTGYIIVDPKTGRFDEYDTRSNRKGYGYIHPPLGPNATTPDDVEVFDRNGRRIRTDKGEKR